MDNARIDRLIAWLCWLALIIAIVVIVLQA